MDFGLWVEPEMINPDSDLYRAHPDWALKLDPLPRPTARNQLVLDQTRSEVWDHIYRRLDDLMTANPIALSNVRSNSESRPSRARNVANLPAW